MWVSDWYIWCGWSNFLEQFALPKILVISQLQPELTHSASLCHRFESFTDKSCKKQISKPEGCPAYPDSADCLTVLAMFQSHWVAVASVRENLVLLRDNFWSLVGSVICLKLALNSSPPKLLWRLPGKVRPSRLWSNRFPNVKFWRLAGHDTCFRLWLNSWLKAKYSRLLG